MNLVATKVVKVGLSHFINDTKFITPEITTPAKTDEINKHLDMIYRLHWLDSNYQVQNYKFNSLNYYMACYNPYSALLVDPSTYDTATKDDIIKNDIGYNKNGDGIWSTHARMFYRSSKNKRTDRSYKLCPIYNSGDAYFVEGLQEKLARDKGWITPTDNVTQYGGPDNLQESNLYLYPNYKTFGNPTNEHNEHILDKMFRENFDFNGFENKVDYEISFKNDTTEKNSTNGNVYRKLLIWDANNNYIEPYFDQFSYIEDNDTYAGFYYFIKNQQKQTSSDLRFVGDQTHAPTYISSVLNTKQLYTYYKRKNSYIMKTGVKINDEYNQIVRYVNFDFIGVKNCIVNSSKGGLGNLLYYKKPFADCFNNKTEKYTRDTYNTYTTTKVKSTKHIAKEYKIRSDNQKNKVEMLPADNEDKDPIEIESFSLNIMDELCYSKLSSNLLIKDKNLNHKQMEDISQLDTKQIELLDFGSSPRILKSVNNSDGELINYETKFSNFTDNTDNKFYTNDTTTSGTVLNTYISKLYHNTLYNSFIQSTNTYTYKLLKPYTAYDTNFNNKLFDKEKFPKPDPEVFFYIERINKITNEIVKLSKIFLIPDIQSDSILGIKNNKNMYSDNGDKPIVDFILSPDETNLYIIYNSENSSYYKKIECNKGLTDSPANTPVHISDNKILSKTCQISRDNKYLYFCCSQEIVEESINVTLYYIDLTITSTIPVPINIDPSLSIDLTNLNTNYMFGKKYLIYYDITTNKNYIINITTTTSTISIYDNDGNIQGSSTTITNITGSIKSFDISENRIYLHTEDTSSSPPTSNMYYYDITTNIAHPPTFTKITINDTGYKGKNDQILENGVYKFLHNLCKEDTAGISFNWKKDKYGTFKDNIQKIYKSKTSIYPHDDVYTKIINFKPIKLKNSLITGNVEKNTLALIYINKFRSLYLKDDQEQERIIFKSAGLIDKFFSNFEQTDVGKEIILKNKLSTKYIKTDTDAFTTYIDLYKLYLDDNLTIGLGTINKLSLSLWNLKCFESISDNDTISNNDFDYITNGSNNYFSIYACDNNIVNDMLSILNKINYDSFLREIHFTDLENQTLISKLQNYGFSGENSSVTSKHNMPFIIYYNDLTKENPHTVSTNISSTLSELSNTKTDYYEINTVQENLYDILLEVKIDNLKFTNIYNTQTIKIKYYNTTLLLDLTLYRLFYSLRNNKKIMFEFENITENLDSIDKWTFLNISTYSKNQLVKAFKDNTNNTKIIYASNNIDIHYSLVYDNSKIVKYIRNTNDIIQYNSYYGSSQLISEFSSEVWCCIENLSKGIFIVLFKVINETNINKYTNFKLKNIDNNKILFLTIINYKKLEDNIYFLIT